MQYLSPATATQQIHVCLLNKRAIFQISSAQYSGRARVAVAYFMAQSCLRIVVNCLRPPETDQNMALSVPLSPASIEFCKITGKHSNSAETCKFGGSAQNSAIRGKLWSLVHTMTLWVCCVSWVCDFSAYKSLVHWCHTYTHSTHTTIMLTLVFRHS